MTAIELARIARDVVSPEGATMAVAVVEHEPGGKLGNGAPSGLGGRTRYGAAFLVDGRTRTAPIALFDRSRDAFALVRLLNGEAPRGQLEPIAPDPMKGAVPDPAGPGVPDPAVDTPKTGGVCVGCGGPLLAGRHGQRRRTCSAACRVAALRRHRAKGRGAATETRVTPSAVPEPSTAVNAGAVQYAQPASVSGEPRGARPTASA